jgi:hypothetical protein
MAPVHTEALSPGEVRLVGLVWRLRQKENTQTIVEQAEAFICRPSRQSRPVALRKPALDLSDVVRYSCSIAFAVRSLGCCYRPKGGGAGVAKETFCASKAPNRPHLPLSCCQTGRVTLLPPPPAVAPQALRLASRPIARNLPKFCRRRVRM